jgi:hypothetical protein
LHRQVGAARALGFGAPGWTGLLSCVEGETSLSRKVVLMK